MLGEVYHQNPRDLVPPALHAVVATWHACRGEGGLMQLPDPGGVNGQAAWLMDAFGICAVAEAELRQEERAREGKP